MVEKQNEDKNENGRVRRLLTNPWLGPVGIFVGIVGILIAIYFGTKPDARRELTLTQTGSSILVYDPSFTKAFTLKPERLLWSPPGTKSLNEKVYAISFAIWNDGKLPIKPEHILKQLEIQIGNDNKRPSAIWEIRSLAWSREEIKFQIKDVSVKRGVSPTIPINFRILEQGDGANLQAIYSASEELDVRLIGTVESIAQNAFFPKKKLFWSQIIAALIAPIFLLYMSWEAWREGNKLAALIVLSLSILIIVLNFYKWDKFTELKEMPKFSYQPIIEASVDNLK